MQQCQVLPWMRGGQKEEEQGPRDEKLVRELTLENIILVSLIIRKLQKHY